MHHAYNLCCCFVRVYSVLFSFKQAKCLFWQKIHCHRLSKKWFSNIVFILFCGFIIVFVIKWSAFSNKQVRFNALSTVVRVATKGCGNGNAWVTLYRLTYSADCVTFNDLVNSAGVNEVNNIFIIMVIIFWILHNARNNAFVFSSILIPFHPTFL